MSTYNLRSRHHSYGLRSQDHDDCPLDLPDGKDFYGDIPSLRLSWTEICHTDNPDISWSSKSMSYPFIKNSKIWINFQCREDKSLYFSKELESILISQDRVDEVIGYINKYLPTLSTRYFNELFGAIEAIKIYPESAYNVGDFCCYQNAENENYLVMITSFNTSKKMYGCLAQVYPVNNVIHYNMDINGERLKKETDPEHPNGDKGSVNNMGLSVVLTKEERQQMSGKQAKHFAVSRVYRMMYETKTKKYENEKKLNKINFKSTIKTLGIDHFALLKESNVGFKKKAAVNGINEREFKSIFIRFSKQLYHLFGWKENKLSWMRKLSASDMALIFGSKRIKDATFKTYHADECYIRYDKVNQEIQLFGHITSTDKDSGATKGTAKEKRERKKNKIKQKIMDEKKEREKNQNDQQNDQQNDSNHS